MTQHLAGKHFGELIVLERAGRNSKGKTLWRCKCFCGKEKIILTASLTLGKTKSCGNCEWHIHHNEAYVSWCAMKQRCNDKNHKDYPRYGGRGITYDPRWDSFIEFYKDMGDPPKDITTGERLSLDRNNNNDNYYKDNCKWSDRSEQQLNKNKYTHQ